MYLSSPLGRNSIFSATPEVIPGLRESTRSRIKQGSKTDIFKLALSLALSLWGKHLNSLPQRGVGEIKRRRCFHLLRGKMLYQFVGEVLLQCRQHFHTLSFSGSCTVGPFLPYPLQGFLSLLMPFTCWCFAGDGSPSPLIVLNNNPMLMIPQTGPPPSSTLLQASSLHILLHMSHLHSEISQASYTCHVHWWSSFHKAYSSLFLYAYLMWWYWDPAR